MDTKNKKVPLCERCPKVYGECKYQEQKDLDEVKSPWTCQGRVMAARVVGPIIREACQKLSDAGLLRWSAKTWDECISGNAMNAFLTYLENHAATVTHYMPEGAESSKKVKHEFDPVWIFKRKIDWEENLPLYKNRVQRQR